jgi:hypothetical protein
MTPTEFLRGELQGQGCRWKMLWPELTVLPADAEF